MKKLTFIIFFLLPVICYARITPITVPKEISKIEQVRVLKILNVIYDNVSDGDIQFDLNKVSPEKYTYRGFFTKVKLLKNTEPLELFFYFKDGVCNACYKAGIAVIDKQNVIADSINVNSDMGYIDANLIEYSNNGTCVILLSNDGVDGFGQYLSRAIYRLNPRRKFVKLYSNGFNLEEKFGDELGIGVTLTADDKAGYRDIVIKEFLNPHTVPTYTIYYKFKETLTPPPSVNKEMVISMKDYEANDFIDGVKDFFSDIFKHQNK